MTTLMLPKKKNAPNTFVWNINQRWRTEYVEPGVVKMLDFIIEDLLITFGGRRFLLTIGIPIGAFYDPLPFWFFLYSYEGDFLLDMNKHVLHIYMYNIILIFQLPIRMYLLSSHWILQSLVTIWLYWWHLSNQLEIQYTTVTIESACFLGWFIVITMRISMRVG